MEGDLYDISRRVREYDPDARLVRDDQSGALGLARLIPQPGMPVEQIVFSTHSLDPATGQRLYGEPDGRILAHQRIADGHRITHLDSWVRRRRDAMRAEREADRAARAEWSRAQAHEFMWRRRRIDLGQRSAFPVPRQV